MRQNLPAPGDGRNAQLAGRTHRPYTPAGMDLVGTITRFGARSARWAARFRPHGLWAAPLAAGLGYLWVVARLASAHGGDVSALVCAGDRYRPPQEVRDHVLVLKRSYGYDGQFFLFAARDPFATRDGARHMDVPAYRYQRILYPWLTALLSGGRTARMPWAMVAINILAMAAGTFAAAAFCRREGVSPWWALFYAATGGLVLATARDLCEPLATALLTAAMAAWCARRTGWAAGWLALACLARETSAVMAPVLCVDAWVRRRDRRGAATLAASLLPLAAWQGYVAWRFGVPPWRGGQQNLGRPLAALWAHAADVFAGTPPHSPVERAFLGLFILTACAAAGLAVREVLRRRDAVTVGLLGFSAMPFVMTHKVWVEPWSYARVLVLGSVFLLLTFARSRDRAYLLPLTAHAALFLLALRWLGVLVWPLAAQLASEALPGAPAFRCTHVARASEPAVPQAASERRPTARCRCQRHTDAPGVAGRLKSVVHGGAAC